MENQLVQEASADIDEDQEREKFVGTAGEIYVPAEAGGIEANWVDKNKGDVQVTRGKCAKNWKYQLL